MVIEFDLQSGYVVPEGDTLHFAFPYALPWSDAINFDLDNGYTPPAGDELYFGGDPVVIDPPDPPAEPDPVLSYNGVVVPWGKAVPKDERLASSWGSERFLMKNVGVHWRRNQSLYCAVIVPWGKLSFIDRSYTSAWSFDVHRSALLSSSWFGLLNRDPAVEIEWGFCTAQQHYSAVSWLRPPKKDTVFSLVYACGLNQRDKKTSSSWLLATARDIPHRSYWCTKYYDIICVRDYEAIPGDSLHFNLDTPLTLTNDSDHLDFVFDSNTYDERCSQQEPTGWRDAYTYIPPPNLPTGLSLRTYIMMSSAQINRLPDNLPIPVKSFSMSFDWNSLHWAISATVVGGDVRDLSPTVDGPIEIEAKINGVTWNCIVDKWSRDRSFGTEGRSITGRGQSAILGAPWAKMTTAVQANERTAVQLMTEQLEYTGWSIDSSAITDWNIPAGTLEQKNEGPLVTIGSLASACGAFVRPDPVAKILYILPRYKVAPWNVTRSDCDLVLPANMVVRDNASWDGRTQANACYMSGGISVFAKREGSAGDEPTTDVNDTLITEVSAARSRSIYEIGKCGFWQKHSLSLPIFDDDVPGLILPGMIVGVDDDSNWNGFVTSVTAKSDWGSGGLVVRQEISVERYVGA